MSAPGPGVDFAPFHPRWDAPQLDEATIAAARSAFEWWYFDLQTRDGLSLVVVLNRRNPVLAAGRPAVYVEYTDGPRTLKRVRTYSTASFAWEEEPGTRRLRLGPHTLELDGDDAPDLVYRLELRLPSLRASLEFRPMHRGFLPTEDGRYFHDPRRPERWTAVSFSAPMMRVKGTVQPRGEAERPVTGRGYHDHPWGTVQMFDTHARWHWGRVSTERSAVMFADVTPAAEFTGRLSFYYQGDFGTFEPSIGDGLRVACEGWSRDHWYGLRFPHHLEVSDDRNGGRARCSESLLDTPIYNRSAATWTEEAARAVDADPPSVGADGSGAAPDGEAGRGARGDAASGGGWVECYQIRPWPPLLVFLGARLAAFFWRPFPYVGR